MKVLEKNHPPLSIWLLRNCFVSSGRNLRWVQICRPMKIWQNIVWPRGNMNCLCWLQMAAIRKKQYIAPSYIIYIELETDWYLMRIYIQFSKYTM